MRQRLSANSSLEQVYEIDESKQTKHISIRLKPPETPQLNTPNSTMSSPPPSNTKVPILPLSDTNGKVEEEEHIETTSQNTAYNRSASHNPIRRLSFNQATNNNGTATNNTSSEEEASSNSSTPTAKDQSSNDDNSSQRKKFLEFLSSHAEEGDEKYSNTIKVCLQESPTIVIYHPGLPPAKL